MLEKRLIATCEHVLEGMVSGTVESVLNETKYPITAVVAVSEKHDLAIIEASGFTAPALTLGDSDAVQVGETIYVVGNPEKHEGTFSIGNISAIRPEGIYLELDKKHVGGQNFPNHRSDFSRKPVEVLFWTRGEK